MPKKITCKKRAFRTEIDAKIVLAKVQWQDKSHRRAVEKRSYKCNLCNKWHLTSQPLRTYPKVAA